MLPLVITVRKRSLRRLSFYTCLSVILFTEGCLSQCMLGYTPSGADTPRADTPPQEQTSSWEQTFHQEQTPSHEQTPPAQCMLGDVGNKQAVRILLECILVSNIFYRLYSSCGKLMFSQMSVILSTGSGWVCLGGWLGGYPIGTRVSMSRGGLGIPVGGEYVHGEGISIPEEVRAHAPDMGPTRGWVLTPLLLTPNGDHRHMYDWQADGTHPTGMPSCSLFISCPACGINVLKHFVKSLPCFLLYFYCLCMCHCWIFFWNLCECYNVQ